MEIEIKNLDIYINRMKKSMLDKIFFIDKIFDPVNTIVDFGCANGDVIRALFFLFPEYRYTGFDINNEMIEQARVNCPRAEFFSSWKDVNIPFAESLINVSSTMHEVFSYGNEQSIAEFKERVFYSGFQYIAIRDMMLSRNVSGKASDEGVDTVRSIYPGLVKDFESVWGSIEEKRNLIHFLLKYRYEENWQREVEENYLPVDVEDLMDMIPNTYEIVYSEHYTLPFIQHIIKKDFGFSLNEATHFKILLKRRTVDE